MRFACFLADRCELLKDTAEGCPTFPESIPSALESFEAMEYGQEAELWSFVNLEEVFEYLRGCKRLQVPPEWKRVVPRAFPSVA